MTPGNPGVARAVAPASKQSRNIKETSFVRRMFGPHR
jgi:hypothetical protein